jgi:hypothetical protein
MKTDFDLSIPRIQAMKKTLGIKISVRGNVTMIIKNNCFF